MIPQTVPGKWKNDLLPKSPNVLPYADTYDNPIPGADHYKDAICYWLSIPKYSLQHSPNLPWEQFRQYAQHHLSLIYGANTPIARTWLEIGPYAVNSNATPFVEQFAEFSKVKISDVGPKDIVFHNKEIYVPLDETHILFIKDPDKKLQPLGPIVISRGKHYSALVRCAYDHGLQGWVPILRAQAPIFISQKLELYQLALKSNYKGNLALHTLPPTVVPEEAELTVRDYHLRHDLKPPSTLPKGHYLQKIATSAALKKLALCEDQLLVFFDIETIYTVSGVSNFSESASGNLVPYSVVWLALTQDEYAAHSKNPMPDEELFSRCTLAKGYNCMTEFSDWITESVLKGNFRQVTLSAFNGSGFDFLFLLRELEGKKELVQALEFADLEAGAEGTSVENFTIAMACMQVPKNMTYFTNQFYNSGRLLAATMRTRDAQGKLHATEIHLSDLAKHLPGMSLASAAKSFKTPHKKKEGFSHHEVQLLHQTRPHDFWNDPEFAVQLEEYNKLDVIVLMELTLAYTIAMSTMTSQVSLDESLPITIGGVVYSHLLDSWEKEPPPIEPSGWTLTPEDQKELKVCGLWEPLTVDMFKTLKKAIPGGCVNIPQGPVQVNEPISSGDVKGLYSYVCTAMPVRFPIGAYRELRSGQGPTDIEHVLGVYHIDVDMGSMMEQNLVFPLPQKQFSTNGELLRNDWNQPVVNDTWVTTPILKILINYGCAITFRGGYEWSSTVRSIDLFRSLLPFLAEKKRQDIIKHSPDANPALRTVCKLFANTAYGKMIQGLFENAVEVMNPRKLYSLTQKKTVEDINVITIMNGNAYATVKYTTESKISRQHPFAVGIFILGWSQYHLFTTYAHRVPRDMIYYIDTDAVKILRAAKERLWEQYKDELIPHWEDVEEYVPSYAHEKLFGGKDGGAYEEELPPNGGAIIVGKKTYVVLAENQDGPCLEDGEIIMSAKGIRRGDVPITAQDHQDLLNLRNFPGQFMQRAQEIYFSRPKLDEVAHHFMKTVLDHGIGYVLTNSLSRIVNNSRRSVGVDEYQRHIGNMGAVVQDFRIKRISRSGYGPGWEVPIVVGQPAPDPEEEDQFPTENLFHRAYDFSLDDDPEGDRLLTGDDEFITEYTI